MEVLIGFLILTSLFSTLIGLARLTGPAELLGNPDAFSAYLSTAMTLVIGLEFVRMLSIHTMDSVIEIMLMTIARQMIVGHGTPVETMVAVLCIALLYVVGKFLYIPNLDDVGRVRMVNGKPYGKRSTDRMPEQDAPDEKAKNEQPAL